MVALIFTLLLLLGLGYKLTIPVDRLLALALLLVGLSLLQLIHVVLVLICLFTAAPILSYWKNRQWTKMVFLLCVCMPCLLSLLLILFPIYQ